MLSKVFLVKWFSRESWQKKERMREMYARTVKCEHGDEKISVVGKMPRLEWRRVWESRQIVRVKHYIIYVFHNLLNPSITSVFIIRSTNSKKMLIIFPIKLRFASCSVFCIFLNIAAQILFIIDCILWLIFNWDLFYLVC